jgi:ABC-type transporter MlaC component
MTKGFTWRQISDKERKEIEEDSKKLLEQFASKLEKINTQELHIKNKSGTRKEGDGWETDEEFKNTMFANAPFVEENSIVAEKGGWK